MNYRKLVLVYACLMGLATFSPRVGAQDPLAGDASPQPQQHPSPLTDLTRTVSTLFSAQLAEAIRSTRDRVYPHGQPMPAELRRKLAPFFPHAVLEKVRYSTEWDAAEDMLPSLILGSGATAAITLADLILFRDGLGVNDPLLWAHELAHVEQYKRLGVAAFATQYLERGWELEAEAMAKADAIRDQLSP